MKLHQGDLYWDLTIKEADYLTLSEDIKTDILVIGGGMSGAMITNALAKKNYEVAVVDALTPGYGSSDGNTGLIQYNSDMSLPEMIGNFGLRHAVDFYRFSIDGMRELKKIADSLSEDVGYMPTHSLYLASAADGVKQIEENSCVLKEYGFPAEYIESRELLKSYGLHAFGAMRSGNDAGLNPNKMVQALHRDSLRRGVKIYKNAKVTQIKEDGVFMINTAGHTILANKIILAMGYAENAYAPIEPALSRGTTFSFVSQPLKEKLWGNEEMVWDDQDPYIYFRLTEDHRLIAGGRDRSSNKLSDEATIKNQTDKIYQKIKQYYPKLQLDIFKRWQSVFGESKDGLPFIGQDPKNPNKYYAFGYGGNGTCYSVMAAMLILCAIEGKPHPYAYTTSYPRVQK